LKGVVVQMVNIFAAKIAFLLCIAMQVYVAVITNNSP